MNYITERKHNIPTRIVLATIRGVMRFGRWAWPKVEKWADYKDPPKKE